MLGASGITTMKKIFYLIFLIAFGLTAQKLPVPKDTITNRKGVKFSFKTTNLFAEGKEFYREKVYEDASGTKIIYLTCKLEEEEIIIEKKA